MTEPTHHEANAQRMDAHKHGHQPVEGHKTSKVVAWLSMAVGAMTLLFVFWQFGRTQESAFFETILTRISILEACCLRQTESRTAHGILKDREDAARDKLSAQRDRDIAWNRAKTIELMVLVKPAASLPQPIDRVEIYRMIEAEVARERVIVEKAARALEKKKTND